MVRKTYLAIVMATLVSTNATAIEVDYFTAPTLEYPVVSDSMSAVLIDIDFVLEYQPVHSVAIVGADELSAQWLVINNDYLVEIGAVGLVVNVESAEQLSILQRYTQMPLMASPAYDFARMFGPYYPLLIDGRASRVRQ